MQILRACAEDAGASEDADLPAIVALGQIMVLNHKLIVSRSLALQLNCLQLLTSLVGFKIASRS